MRYHAKGLNVLVETNARNARTTTSAEANETMKPTANTGASLMLSTSRLDQRS